MPKKLPKPRWGTYYGMEIVHLLNIDGTWMEGEEFCYPAGGMTRRCYARCADGVLRIFKCGIPDTMFSVPASGKIKRKYVKGFISSSETGFKFTSYS